MGICVSNGTARWYQKQIMITISAEPATHHPFAETRAWYKIWNIRVRCWNRSDQTLLGQKMEVLFSIFMVGSDPIGDTTTRTGDGNSSKTTFTSL